MATRRVSAEPLAVDLAVLAKAPRPGRVKTRLIPALGAEGAARLQRRLLLHTLVVAQASGLGLQLWGEPAEARFFRALAQATGLVCRPQPPGDLGQRMQAIFAAQARTRGRPLVLIGSDCPAFTPQHLRQAAERLLAGDTAVFTPAEDGGYVLVGLQRPQPELFEGVAWSTPQVMDQTRERLRALEMRWSELPALWDLDTPEDLPRWQALSKGLS